MDKDNNMKVTDHRATTQESGTGAKREKGCGCAQNAAHDKHMYPKVTFSTFVLSLSSSGMVHLGEVPEPETGQIQENLPLAKHTIDILAMLKDKTSKCLDPDEAKLLDGVLYELRMVYVMKNN